MPNHIVNLVEFQSSADLQRVLAECKSEDRLFDFNAIIPMPASLNIESSTETDMALLLYQLCNRLPPNMFERHSFFNLVGSTMERLTSNIGTLTKENIDKWLATQEKDLLAIGEAAYKNHMTYGAKTWYEWAPENWGTKWNAYAIEVKSETVLSLQTAYDAPMPIVHALASKYLGIAFTWTYADEDTGCNCGITTYKDGVCTISKPENQSNEAYAIYEKCWGPSQCFTKDENGNYTRFDCDDCRNAETCC